MPCSESFEMKLCASLSIDVDARTTCDVCALSDICDVFIACNVAGMNANVQTENSSFLFNTGFSFCSKKTNFLYIIQKVRWE